MNVKCPSGRPYRSYHAAHPLPRGTYSKLKRAQPGERGAGNGATFTFEDYHHNAHTTLIIQLLEELSERHLSYKCTGGRKENKPRISASRTIAVDTAL